MGRMMRTLLLLPVMLFLAGTGSPALARDNGVPIMGGRVQGDYARITFTWPTNTHFKMAQSGNQLTVSFDDAVGADPSGIPAKLKPYVTAARKGSDGHSIILDLNQNYPVRSFISGTTVGVDVLQIKRPLAAAPATPPAPEPAKAEVKEPAKPAAPAKEVAKEAVKNPPAKPEPAKAAPAKESVKEPAKPEAAAKPAAPAKPAASVKEEKPQAHNSKDWTTSAPAAPAAAVAAKPVVVAAPVTEAAAPATPAPAAEVAAAPAQSVNLLDPKQLPPPVPAALLPEGTPSSPLLGKSGNLLQPDKAAEAVNLKPAPAPAEAVGVSTPAPAPVAEKTPGVPAILSGAPEKTAEAPAAVTPAVAEAPAKTESKLSKNAEKVTAAPVPEVTSSPAQAEAEPAAAAIATAVSTVPTAEDAATVDMKPIPMVVLAQKAQNDMELHFPWKDRVAAAAFTRGNMIWVIFNHPANVNMDLLKGILPPYVTDVSTTLKNGHTVMMMTTNVAVNVSAGKKKDSYEWIITLSRHNRTPSAPIVPEVLTAPPLKPNVFIAALETAPIFTATDPVLGSELQIIPTFTAGQGTFPERRFVDFILPRTAQGIVVEPLSDQLRVVKLRNGIRLTGKDGVTLTEDLPKLDLDTLMASEAISNSLFPYDKWKAADYQAFLRKKQQLQQDIVKANDEKAGLLRLELAKLFMGEGRHLEALAVINMLRGRDAKFYTDYQVAALRGAANFMLGRVAEAAGDFADPSLADEQEIDYWKQMCAVMLGQSEKSLRFPRFDKVYSRNYPPDVRQRMALAAANQMVEKKNFNTVYRIFDILAGDKQFEPIRGEADYLTARMLAENGHHKEAEDKLNNLLDKSTDEPLRARAEYLLATMQFEIGEITRSELIDRLDRLRTTWRGDEVELNSLKLLADLMPQEGQYEEALMVMRDILRYYPTTPDAPEFARKMAALFVDLFNNGKADKMEPLKALAMFYEFKDLTPLGQPGDQMIQNLADRLASVDLLRQAAALLEHQVKYRLEKEDRSRVGARLALLYLFDREPRKALDVLSVTDYGSNPEKLDGLRRHLAAKAYAQTGQWEKALALLKRDFTEDGKQIKLDVYWENKDWANVAATAEDMLAGRKDITAQLTDSETQVLLRLAVAYNFTGDTLQLKYVRDYFSPLLKNNPYQSQISFLTNVREPLNPDNITTLAKDISQIETFLDTYHTNVQKQGLSAAVQ